ncbi:hypothetical protein [Pararhizobium sp. DWP1-1-3]|uniref:hypothetical protein n=1 Tax=Pararhizobium sp. DWP1-1-3 TaxID=2804652 RepID=UPI003CEB069E
MTGYIPYRTASFLGPINEVHHLFAVMNGPCGEKQCLIINVTTIKAGKSHDTSCVLEAGAHPFIKHPSFLLYRLAQITRAAHIGNMIDKKYYLTREDWDAGVFQRIVDGIRISDDTSGRIIRYADQNGIV